MRVSESEKLGVSVLGCHFSEKAEHIPIKKRRFLFKASSPPHHETSPRAFNQEIKVNPNQNPNPTCVHESVTQVVKKELVKAKHEPKEDDDFSGISILAAAACSNCLGAEADHCEGSGIGIGIAKSTEAPTTVELKESISKSAKEESDSHTSRKESESMMDNSISQPSSESVIPTPKDVRFNWDLNTVMDDPWEEPFVSEHEVSSHNNVTFFKKDDRTKVNSRDCELGSGTESGIPSKDISILNDENELKLVSSKPEPMSCELDNSQHSVAVAESVIPVTLENPTPGIFSKWQTSCDTEAVDTKLSMDCSVPPGFDHRLNLHISKENMVAESPIPVPCKPEFEKHDLSLTPAASMENGALSSKADESMVKMETTSIPSMRDSEAKLENGIRYDNSRGGSGYDSQYEDGELRESSINAWKGEEHELVINNREDDNHDLNIGITDSHESKSSPTPCTQETSPGIKPEETDLTSSVVLPEILDNNTDEVLTGSEPNEMVTNSNSNSNERQEIIHHQSDEWKMNVSGLDHLPENQRIPSSNFTKTRNFTGRKFSYGVQKDGFDPEDAETKGEGSRFYRKEPITRIGGPSTRDVFLTRGRFRVQGCSSNAGERESGVVRSMGRGSGRYSPPPPPPHNRVWNRSPDRKNRLPSPTYPGPPFLRPMLEDSGTLDNNIITEPPMDPTEPNSRPNTSSSYLTRRPFRSRSPMNREANDFRARLGLRPTADTSDHRFMTRGRGRGRVGIRYGTRVENNQPGPGPRRYHGPGSDECDEFITDYPNPFPRRRRCFSPVERRGTGNHYSGSRSRSPVSNFRRRSRSRSRSPSFRIRRPRSPNYRRGFDPEFRGNTSPPLNPRWVNNYKERPTVFVERERERERFSFYERKPKQNEFYRSGQRFDPTESGRGRPRYIDDSETDRTNNNGYRRGGFVRRYNNNMDGHGHGHVKRFHYDDGDGFGRGFDARDKHALEAHARGNMKSSSTDAGGSSRFRDFSRRSREEDRRSRERKDSSADPTKEEKEKHIVVKDQSNLHPIISVKEKEGDSSKTNANVGL